MTEQQNQESDSTAHSIRQLIRFLRVVWHRRLVIIGTLTISSMLGSLYFYTAVRIYKSEAQLLVVNTGQENLPTSMAGGRDDHAAIATYEKLVSSPLVLQSAATLLQKPVRSLFNTQDPDQIAKQIAGGLTVGGIRNTNLLHISEQLILFLL